MSAGAFRPDRMGSEVPLVVEIRPGSAVEELGTAAEGSHDAMWRPCRAQDRHSSVNRACIERKSSADACGGRKSSVDGAAQACALSSISAFPPSITSSCPVTYEASADARNAMAPATSSGLPARRIGEASAASASAGV